MYRLRTLGLLLLLSCGGKTASGTGSTTSGGGAGGASSAGGSSSGGSNVAGVGGSSGTTGGVDGPGAGGMSGGSGHHQCSFAPTGGPKSYPGLWFMIGCVVSPAPCPGAQVCCPTGCIHVCDGMSQQNWMACVSGTTCADAIECPAEAQLPWLGPGAHPLDAMPLDGFLIWSPPPTTLCARSRGQSPTPAPLRGETVPPPAARGVPPRVQRAMRPNDSSPTGVRCLAVRRGGATRS